MTTRALTQALLAFLLALSGLSLHAQEMQPGLWEIATTMKMQGMQMPPAKMKLCYTAQDLSAGKQYSGAGDSQCAIANLKTAGSNVSFDIACTTQNGKMSGTVKGTVSPTAYSFEQKLRMTPDPGMGDMLTTVQGRRLGDCK
jgi:hypothetical protein